MSDDIFLVPSLSAAHNQHSCHYRVPLTMWRVPLVTVSPSASQF
jgi:hypothetical protein